MENTEKSRESTKHLIIISAFMGFLGAINSTVIGFYILSTLLNLIQISSLIIQGYIFTPIIGVVTALFIYGSCLILKNRNIKKGAKINFTCGLILAFLYVYYTYFSQPLRLLSWLAPGGILLIIPPILSGIIGRTASG